jgi:hypothetical protein
LLHLRDLREWLFHSHMGTGSGVTNSSGVGWGVGAKKLLGVTSGVYHLFGSNCGRFFFFFFFVDIAKSSAVFLSFVVCCGSHGL